MRLRSSPHKFLTSATCNGCRRYSIAEPSLCLFCGSIADLGFAAASRWARCQVLAEPVAGRVTNRPQSRPTGEVAPCHGLQEFMVTRVQGTVYGTSTDMAIKNICRSRLESSNTSVTLHLIVRSAHEEFVPFPVPGHAIRKQNPEARLDFLPCFSNDFCGVKPWTMRPFCTMCGSLVWTDQMPYNIERLNRRTEKRHDVWQFLYFPLSGSGPRPAIWHRARRDVSVTQWTFSRPNIEILRPVLFFITAATYFNILPAPLDGITGLISEEQKEQPWIHVCLLVRWMMFITYIRVTVVTLWCCIIQVVVLIAPIRIPLSPFHLLTLGVAFSPRQLSFNWGLSPLTSFGPGPVSARWTGKLLGPATETFNIFFSAKGGVRFFLDHELIIDAWEGIYCVLRILAYGDSRRCKAPPANCINGRKQFYRLKNPVSSCSS